MIDAFFSLTAQHPQTMAVIALVFGLLCLGMLADKIAKLPSALVRWGR